jgi:biopolymer transport protein ExbD
MARKPSERRHFHEANEEINLIPMMNLISLLIPCLLISMVFVEIATINVSAPAIGSDAAAEPPEDKPDKPPLNLTITITDKGYTLAGSGGVIGPSAEQAADASQPTIPLTQKTVSCGRFIGTWAPPRERNRASAKCESADDTRSFFVYDRDALGKKLVEIKDAYPDEIRVTIAAESSVEFEAITDVMDASRELRVEGEEARELFPEVVLSPGLS